MATVCRRRSNCQKEPRFGKSSCFPCLMKYFPGSWSGVMKSSVPRCMFGSCGSKSSYLANQWPWFRTSHQRCSIKKSVLKNFAEFIVQNLCQCLIFFIKLQAWAQFLRTPFLQNTSGRLLLLIPQSQWVYIATGCSFVAIC